jgi:transcriptional regulator with XRE-family HTH domain
LPRRKVADSTARAFGAAVREFRLKRKETLEEVARRLGRMDAKYLGEIERGWHSPTISTAKKIADALDVPLAKLVRKI